MFRFDLILGFWSMVFFIVGQQSWADGHWTGLLAVLFSACLFVRALFTKPPTGV